MKRSHRLDVYGCELRLATTKQGVEKLAAEFDYPKGFNGLADGQTTTVLDAETGALYVLVFIDQRSMEGNVARLINVLAHEASHATGFILKHFGVKPRHPETEQAAYLTGWITEWLWRAL